MIQIFITFLMAVVSVYFMVGEFDTKPDEAMLAVGCVFGFVTFCIGAGIISTIREQIQKQVGRFENIEENEREWVSMRVCCHCMSTMKMPECRKW